VKCMMHSVSGSTGRVYFIRGEYGKYDGKCGTIGSFEELRDGILEIYGSISIPYYAKPRGHSTRSMPALTSLNRSGSNLGLYRHRRARCANI
jgi:hypothetical protein